MADPRKAVGFTDITAPQASYLIDGSTITYSATAAGGSAVVGRAVNLSAARTVQLAADGEAVIGKLIRVEADGVALVQTQGYVTLPGGNSASLTLGKKIVGALDASTAKGFIRDVATGTAAELGVARGFIVDASTASATIVNL